MEEMRLPCAVLRAQLGFHNAADQQGAVPHCTPLLADAVHTLSLYTGKK